MPSLSAARAHRSLGWSLALLAFAQLIYSLDINIVFVALPEIGAGLGFSEQTLQWVVSAYTVFCGGFLLLGGRAVDLLGQRRMFIGALWLYALSSLVGGLAWNPAVIVIARAVQGIGAALLFPSTLSLINRLFEEGPPRNRALAIWRRWRQRPDAGFAGRRRADQRLWLAVGVLRQRPAGRHRHRGGVPGDSQGRPARRSFDMPGALTATAGPRCWSMPWCRGRRTAGWPRPSSRRSRWPPCSYWPSR